MTAQRGDYTITIRAKDDGNGNPAAALTGETSFVLSVLAPNAAPQLPVLPARVAVSGQALTFEIAATDPTRIRLPSRRAACPPGPR